MKSKNYSLITVFLFIIFLIYLFFMVGLIIAKNSNAATITKTLNATWTAYTQTQIDQYKILNIELFDKDNKSLGKTTNGLINTLNFQYSFEENDIQCFYLKANLQDGNQTGNSNIFGFYYLKGKLVVIPFPDNKTLKIEMN